MLIGVDWGGTKIEVVALEPDGTELLRIRRDTPRGDYEGCLRTVLELIDEAEASTSKASIPPQSTRQRTTSRWACG